MTEIHSLSGAYAVDALDDLERAQFERHLAECAACREEVAGLRAAAASLAALTETVPPTSLRDRVLADIATVRPLPPEVPTRKQATERATERASRRTGLLVAAAAAILALGGTAVVTQPWANDADQSITAADQVLAAPDAQKVAADVDAVPGASITVVRSRSRNQAVMVTRGVPQPPADKVYQAWFLEPDGRMVSVGLMPSVRDDEPVLLDPDADAASAKAVAITLEPAGGSPSPTQEPLVQVSFGQA
jgi:anti-sigma-K factor RskA